MPVLRNTLPPRRRSESRPLSHAAQQDQAQRAGAHAPEDRVLAVAPSWVGDAILSEPLFARIRDAGVEAPIDVIAPPWCGPVYARMRGIGRIIDSPAAHGEFAWQRRRALGVALRAARYTHAYVLPNTWKSALVPWFAQVPRRIGYRGEARYRLLTDARRLDRHGLPQLVARYAALAVPRGEPAPAPAPPTLVPNAANLAQAMRALDLSRAPHADRCLDMPVPRCCGSRAMGTSTGMYELRRSADGETVDAQRRLAHAHRHALPIPVSYTHLTLPTKA